MTDTARKHSWNTIAERRIPACDSPDGNDRTKKTCAHCSLVKITVHPPHGRAWREWRTKAEETWVGDSTPPCVEAKPELQVASESATEVQFS